MKTVTAKIPTRVVTTIDALARKRGVTRSALIREIAEAAVDGRVTFLDAEEKMARLLRARIREITGTGTGSADAASCRAPDESDHPRW